MLSWIAANLANIVIVLVLLLVVAGIIAKLIRDKKKGRSSCGCGCEHCAMRGECHGSGPH